MDKRELRIIWQVLLAMLFLALFLVGGLWLLLTLAAA
jgi:hypothetical protein